MSNNPLPQGKRIHVYRSGDPNFVGANVNYNPMRFKRMDNFLDEIAEKVPTWGAVRSIHTPNTGTLVTDLNSIEKDKKYVAAGPKGFVSIPGGYENIGKRLPRKSEILSHKMIRRLGFNTDEIKTIWVYRNGDVTSRSRPFRISHDDDVWEKVLERMSEIVRLASGPVKRLYDFHGKIIDSPGAVQDKQYYVAAGPGEAFRSVTYGGRDSKNLDDSAKNIDDAVSNARSYGHINISSRKSNPNFYKKPRRRKSKSSLNESDEDNEHSEFGSQGNIEEIHVPQKKKIGTNGKELTLTSYRNKILNMKAFKGTKTHPNRRKSQDKQSTEEALSKLSLNEAPNSGMRRSKSVDSKTSAEPETNNSIRNWSSQDDMENIYETLTPNTNYENSDEVKEVETEDEADENHETDSHRSVNDGSLLTTESDDIFKAKQRRNSKDESENVTEDEIEEEEKESKEEEEEKESKDHFNDQEELPDSGRGSLFSNESDHGGIFKAKQKSRPSTTISVDYDADNGGIFRAHSRSQYTRNAKTVLEDSKTKIEIPVDHMDATEVMEEVY